MLTDIRLAVRALAARPGLFAVCVLTLALGVGSVSAIFSVVNGTLLQPLPYPDAEQIVRINRTQGQWGGPISAPVLDDWREGTGELVTAMGAFTGMTANLTGDGEAQRLAAYRVTPGFWDVMGLPAAVGRLFNADEDAAGERVVVLSHRFWHSRYGANPGIIGRDLMLNGVPYHVIGVLPASFKYLGSEVYLPTSIDSAAADRGSNSLFAIARLADGVSLEQFNAVLATINDRLAAEYPANHEGLGARTTALPELLNSRVRQPLLILQAASVFVLLIACANLANLLLARGTQREREFAVRVAMGAGTARLVRVSLAEAAVIAAVGGALGVALAAAVVPALLSLAPAVMPDHGAPGVDLIVVLVSLAAGTATVLLFGLWPALKAATVASQSATLKEDSRGGGRARARNALVVVEVALSVALLVGAGLLIESMRQLGNQDGGVDPRGVLTASFVVDGVPPVPGEELMTGYWRHVATVAPQLDRILERVRAIPGVRGVGLSDALPLSGINNTSSDMTIVGREVPAGEPPAGATWRFVNPDFARTLGTEVVAGRHIEDSDFRAGVAPSSVLVNEAFVRRYLADVDPLGQRVTFFDGSEKTIVGVVEDTRGLGLDREPLTEVFMHYGYAFFRQYYLALKVDGEPAAYAEQLRLAIREVEPGVPVFAVQPMDGLIGGTVQLRRFNMILMSVFSAVALSLAALGLYGVISYSVAQRRREIGIRLSLGADVRRIAAMVLGQGLRVVGVGIMVGVAAAYGTSQLLASQLYGVAPGEPTVFAVVAAALALVGLAATLVPARRAARTAPMEALRYE